MRKIENPQFSADQREVGRQNFEKYLMGAIKELEQSSTAVKLFLRYLDLMGTGFTEASIERGLDIDQFINAIESHPDVRLYRALTQASTKIERKFSEVHPEKADEK